MEKSMASWFYMRPGFTTFRLEPDKHPQFLFGTRERKQRDYLMEEIEGASFGHDGYKAVVFGDYGRGKTHMCHNLEYQIRHSALPLLPIYIKCSAYTSKEPFPSLFREMVLRLSTSDVKRVATAYANLVTQGKAKPIEEVVRSEEIAFVFEEGLTAVSEDAVRNCMRWLGGEAKVPMQLISTSLKPQLTDSRDFGAVMRGLAHLYATVDGKILLYLVDEAERLESISNVDMYAIWLAALRELTEIPGIGMIFFVGAVTRNQLPTLLLSDEVMRRVGVANYVEFTSPSRDQLKAFLLELFATFIAKGPIPEQHAAVVDEEALDAPVPDALKALAPDAASLETYPFEPEALEDFVENLATGSMANKPSEVLIRLLKASQRAMRKDKHLIGRSIVNDLNSEGL